MSAATVSQPQAASAPKGLIARAFGVLASPAATFAGVAARPQWLGILGLVLLVTMAAQWAFFSTEVGQQAIIDQQVRSMESFGRTVDDAQYAQLERMAPYAMYFTAGAQLVGLPLVALVVSGITFAVFNGAMGADAAFKQVFAIVAHSGVVIALQQLFVLPLDYVQETLSSPTTLAVFVGFLDENTFLARLLGSIDLFVIWWAVTLAIGIGVLYKRRTGPVAVTLLGVYAAVAIVLAAVKTALAGA